MHWIDATEALSKQQTTPEGYLVCKDVTIARTGVQHYHLAELPAGGADAGPDGMVAVTRSENEVFSPSAIESFCNAPITLGHPATEVDADNWGDLSVGYVRNPRRSGSYLVADLVLTDAQAIRLVRDHGWRSVSCGYDARYVRTGIASARQADIRGNHVAILPPDEAARCGDVCRINDHKPEEIKKVKTKPALRTSIAELDQQLARFVDQAAPSFGTSTASYMRQADPRVPETGNFGAQQADDLPAGVERVLQLPSDEGTAWEVVTNAQGEVWLCRHVTGNGAGVGMGGRPIGGRQHEMTGDTDWLRRQRLFHAAHDAAGSQLRAINAANRKFWGQA